MGRDGVLKPMDAEQLRENAHKMVDFIADYYKNIETFPVLSQVEVCFSSVLQDYMQNCMYLAFAVFFMYVIWLYGIMLTCNELYANDFSDFSALGEVLFFQECMLIMLGASQRLTIDATV